jgi:hypothetical protein
VDLSLYKDEAQLDKSPRKRKRGAKSADEESDDDDEDYEDSSRRRKSNKRSPVSKNLKSSGRRPAANSDSSESDEENLMEIKKKAKRQVRIGAILTEREFKKIFLLFSGCSHCHTQNAQAINLKGS